MKTIDEEFGIIRGGLTSYNSFQGQTEYTHGFFIYNDLLCHKYHMTREEIEEYPENIHFVYYNREKDEVEEYWWGIRDGDFKCDIQTIYSIKYIPFKFFEYLSF